MVLVKICGIASAQETEPAFAAGAEFIGVLVDFPNTYLSLDQAHAAAICSEYSGRKTAVLTLETDEDKIISMLKKVKPWGIQLLRPTPAIIRTIKANTNVKVIAVVHVQDASATDNAAMLQTADFLLLDSKDGPQLGGTGKPHDWNISKIIVSQSAIPVILAGGLNSNNVCLAIERVHPYGVDVESAMRNKNGFRDLNKVTEFIKRVKCV